MVSKTGREKILKKETLYTEGEITLRRTTLKLASGKLFKQEIVERPNEVIIIPQISENEIILVKQFRRGVEEVLLELPGGKVKRGENETIAGNRELEEETGYTAKKLERLTEAFAAPSWLTSKRTFFLAQELTPVEHPEPSDPDENIEVIRLPFKKALAKIASGKIKDEKTILGLLLTKKLF